MRCLLLKKFFIEAMELLFHAPDLPPRRSTLLLIEFYGFCAGEPPMNTL
jgi:hypothetical protein